jgi:hypothetical protein
MGVKLVSASAGSVEIVAPTTASNYTATLPAGTGTMVVNGVNGSIVSGTAVNSTSGTSIDFTSIPSWVKRITVMLNNTSTNGSSNMLVQIGAGSITSTGYFSNCSYNVSTSISIANSTAGFIIVMQSAAQAMYGFLTISLLGSNNWVANGSFAASSTASNMTNGGVTLSGTLDRVRITSVSGTETFDLGSVNILYE